MALAVGAHGARGAFAGAALGELGVGGGDQPAAVVVADHRGGGLRVKAESAVLDRVDHPLQRSVLEFIELEVWHPGGDADRVPADVPVG